MYRDRLRRKSLAGEPGGKRGGADTSNNIWWLRPRVALYFSVLMLLISYLVPENVYLTLFETRKYIDFNFVVAGLAIYAGFFVGTFFTVKAGAGSQKADVVAYCRWIIWPLFFLTILGYAVWYTIALLRVGGVSSMIGVLAELLLQPSPGLSDYVKFEIFATIGGVTTIAQLGIVYVVVEALLWVTNSSERKFALMRFSVIVLLTLSRVLVHSERLGLVEFVLPLVVLLVGVASLRRTQRAFAQLAPLLLGSGVFVLFAVGEYFRSWNYFKGIYPGSYMGFALERFLGYYTAANNNAAVFYYYQPLQPLRHTLNSFFELPLFGYILDNLYKDIILLERYVDYEYPYSYLLEVYSNPALNNIALIGLLPAEFSVYLAPVAAFVMGVVSASLYKSFLSWRMLGILLYPSWFVGLLDISRIYYWADQRYFPVLVFVPLSLFLFAYVKSPSRKADSGATRRARAAPRPMARET